MGSHSTRKEERRTRRRLRKERKRTLRREQKERHRLKRAEKAARKEARRVRREARTAYGAYGAYGAPVDPELDELRRLRYLHATGTPTPAELYEARAWRDGPHRPQVHYAPPTPAELAELRRLREGEATDVEVAQARDFAARASVQSRSSVPPRQSAKKSLGWGASVYSPHRTAEKRTKTVIHGDIRAHIAARDQKDRYSRQKYGTPINPPELLFVQDGKTIHAKIERGRMNSGVFQFELQPFDAKKGKFWIDATLLQHLARDTSLRSWCADQVAQNCEAASYPH